MLINGKRAKGYKRAPEFALQLIEENKRTKDPYLDLGNCGLTHLPEELGGVFMARNPKLERYLGLL